LEASVPFGHTEQLDEPDVFEYVFGEHGSHWDELGRLENVPTEQL
jgi:hypothetical protein